MFPADTHVHSLISKDCDFSRREMAAAAARRGLWGICFTDHYDVIDMDSSYNPHFDWEPVRRAQAEARRQVGEKFPLLYGLELGNAPRDFEAAERAVSEPGLDFALCSVHNLCAELGGTDFYFVDYNTPQLCHAHLEDYFRTMEQSLTWGNFDVLAHIPYPLRYMRDRDGQAVDLEPYWPQIEKILKKTIDMGKGIECNCKNWTPAMKEDYRQLLLRYRALGGTIVTVGSDAHTPEAVGGGVEEACALLKETGFDWVAVYRRRKPEYFSL